MSTIESDAAPSPARDQMESASPPIPRNSPQLPAAENRLDDPPGGPVPQGAAGPEVAELTERQLSAIEMLATGKSPAAVARLLQVDRKTLYNWRQNCAFREAAARRREELWHEASARLRGLVHPSLNVLAEMLADRFDERNRVRAATILLRMANFGKPAPPSKDATR